MFKLLPLFLAYIMFTLGLQLKLSDFAPVIKMPKAVLLGLLNQMLLVPMIAFALVTVFNPPADIAFGVMLVSFCAGGATSNIMSLYAHANVALSIVLTAISSMLAMVSIPFWVGIFYPKFFGGLPNDFSAVSLGIKVVVLTTIPVLIGILCNRYLSQWFDNWQNFLQKMATLLFALVVVVAIVHSWDLVVSQLAHIGGLVLMLATILLVISYASASVFNLNPQNRRTIAIETSLQNGAMGIALAPLISGAVSAGAGLPSFAIPSAIYGVLMNAVVLPFVFWHYFQNDKQQLGINKNI